MIHPTAIVSADADLGSGVEIGPYCVVGDGVRLGDNCRLHNHVTIAGPSVIGPRNVFYPYSVIGQQSQDLKYSGEPTRLEIGSDNTFREFVTVNRGTLPETKTVVGSRGNFLAYTHIAHDCVVGDDVIFSNCGTLAGHVIVEDGAILGGLTAVHQFCRIGRLAITGGCSKIVQDVPPFTIVDGNPAAVRGWNRVGLQRRGFTEDDIRPLKDAYKSLFLRNDRNLSVATDEVENSPAAENDLVRHLCRFIRASTRGITRG